MLAPLRERIVVRKRQAERLVEEGDLREVPVAVVGGDERRIQPPSVN
jgi:hypothetical protein